jgi:hypothetical protein
MVRKLLLLALCLTFTSPLFADNPSDPSPDNNAGRVQRPQRRGRNLAPLPVQIREEGAAHSQIEELRMTLEKLRSERAEPAQLEKVERAIAEAQRRLEERSAQRGLGPQHGPGPQHEQEERHRVHGERLEHLHQAADHLRHAGMGELAERVMDAIRELDRNFTSGLHPDGPPHPDGPHRPDGPPHHGEHRPGDPRHDEFRALQEQIDDLRRAMHELREQLERGPRN